MKLISFIDKDGEEKAGIYHDGKVAGLSDCNNALPKTMQEFLSGGDEFVDLARGLDLKLKEGKLSKAIPSDSIQLIAPVPHPPSCRDGYAFRQHVAAARKNRGVDMIPEFDQYPIFYFTNHLAVFGEGDILVEKDHLQKCDFELEIAAVIGKGGRNIPSSKADEHILGYTVMNDLSARTLQMEEMLLSLGPAKGKDFATSIGPWLVTKDEIEDRRIPTKFGDKYDLVMTARHNGQRVSYGNVKDMNWTFAEIIERASYGVDLQPGDVIGSGTVGTGCYLELNGTWTREAKEKGEQFSPVWLQNGDIIELEIENLGILRNRIVLSNNNYSILAKKKL
jgi:fumarylacetoacetate (FAA) hydrolase